MAGGLKSVFRSGVLAASLFLLYKADAGAQTLNDPTRPPAAFTDSPAAAAAGGPVLQSVKISATERSAIIGGESVKLGGKYREARVIRITENEVALRSASGTEILRMYPGVEIKPAAAASPGRKPAADKSRNPATNTLGKHG